jgi:hypothetical protein
MFHVGVPVRKMDRITLPEPLDGFCPGEPVRSLSCPENVTSKLLQGHRITWCLRFGERDGLAWVIRVNHEANRSQVCLGNRFARHLYHRDTNGWPSTCLVR